jgi:beta-lactamase regulating signal transducer with metallopeptidase domain
MMEVAVSGTSSALVALAAWLLTFLAHSSVLLGAVWALTLAVHSPGARDAVWRAASVAPLVTSLAAVTLPAHVGGGAAAASAGAGPALSADGAMWLVLPAAAILAVWVLAAAVGVYRLERNRRRHWRRIGRRETLPDVEIAAALRRLQDRAGCARTVFLTTSPNIRAPVAIGTAEICLPATFGTLTTLQQESVLAHELGHLVRRDPLWRFGLALLAAVFPLQPLLLVARRESRECAEMLADDYSINVTGQRRPLVESLAALAGGFWTGGPQTAAFGDGRSPLVRRAARVLDRGRRPARAQGRTAAVLAWSALLCAGVFIPPVARTGAPEPVPFPLPPPGAGDLSGGKRLIVRTLAGEELQAERDGDGTLRQRFSRGGVVVEPDAADQRWIAAVLDRHAMR